MKHKLDRFAEIAAYPFDGFMLNIRGHVNMNSSEDYGYNPEVRAAFKRKYGKDIWRDQFDRAAWLDLRADALDRYLAGCKKLASGRPLYVGVADNGSKPAPGVSYGMVFHVRRLGVPFHCDKWFASGSVDGVMMHCDFFPERFRGKTVSGKKVAVGFLREMIFHPKEVSLEDDLERCRRAGLDEIELYETLVLIHKQELLETIKKFCAK